MFVLEDYQHANAQRGEDGGGDSRMRFPPVKLSIVLDRKIFARPPWPPWQFALPSAKYP